MPNSLVLRGYSRFDWCARNLQSLVLLALRVCCGLELFISGRAHLHHIPLMLKNFQSWGVPLPHLSVYVSAYTEMIGGSLLAVGLLARLISFPLTFNFVVAYLTASRDTVVGLINGPDRLGSFNDLTGDAALFPLVVALTVLAFGPGRISLDFVLSRTIFKKQRLTPAPARPAS